MILAESFFGSGNSLRRVGKALLTTVTIIAVAHALPAEASHLSISIQAPPKLLLSPVARTAIEDTRTLLQQAMPSAIVNVNKAKAQVLIALPDSGGSTGRFPVYSSSTAHLLAVPDRSYRWKSRSEAGQRVLRLQAHTPEGVACGLYGLLQGKLGFRFQDRKSVV